MNSRLTIFFISLLFLLIDCSSQVCSAQSVSKKKTVAKQTKSPVPNIIGLKLKDARMVLDTNGISIGAIVYGHRDSSDTLDEFIVYRQIPSSRNAGGTINYVEKNRLIDIWVQNPKLKSDSSNKQGRFRAVIGKRSVGTGFD